MEGFLEQGDVKAFSHFPDKRIHSVDGHRQYTPDPDIALSEFASNLLPIDFFLLLML